MNKPLKRHPFIVAFSKDHHYGLLLVWKIRQGIKREIATERISGYVKLFAEIDLFLHFDEEENFLLPLLYPNDVLRKKVEKDHLELRETLNTIFEIKSDVKIIERFADMLETHIRFEEREFFQHLQEKVNLDLISVNENKKNNNLNYIDEIWIDNFWESVPAK